VRTALADLRGTWRLATHRRRPARRGARPGTAQQLWRFAAVGVLSTLAYSGLYWLLREASPPPVANGVALLLTAIANTAVNRRLTFGVRGRRLVLRDHAGGLVAFGLALAITTVSLTTLHTLWPGSSRTVELVVLASANIVATLIRFVLLRTWILHPRRSGDEQLRRASEESS
jgi:putative flippase GtrA